MDWEQISELIDELDSLRSNPNASAAKLRKLHSLLNAATQDISEAYTRKVVEEAKLPRLGNIEWS